jgi:hypothetical protein
MNAAVACFILAGLPAAWAVDPAPLPKEIRTAKTVFVLNQGIEAGTMDVVYDEIRKWSHWTLTDDHEKADLIIVLSAQNYVNGMATFGSGSATATATTYGNTTVGRGYGSSQGVAVPIMQETRYLTVVEPKSGLALLTLNCRRREINGNARTGRVLVNRLKERFPKDQR